MNHNEHLDVSALTGELRGREPARSVSTATTRTAAFTLTSNANGTDTLTLTMVQILDPATLQRALARNGIRALVRTGTYCTTSPRHPTRAASECYPSGRHSG